MAAKKTAAETPETKPEQKPTRHEPKYTLGALKNHSKSALGVEANVLEGAFSGVPEDAEFTLAEAAAHIDSFMRKPIPRRDVRR